MESLLGEHSNLVNLDNLVQVQIAFQTIFFLILTLQPKVSGGTAKNPFADQPNPFQAAAAPKPTINQLRTRGQVLFEDKGVVSAFIDWEYFQPTAQMGAWPDNSGVQSNNNADINPFF